MVTRVTRVVCICCLPAQRDALVKLPGDSSVMTYAGHLVKHTLLRARFSPAATTGQVRVLFYILATHVYIIKKGEISVQYYVWMIHVSLPCRGTSTLPVQKEES